MWTLDDIKRSLGIGKSYCQLFFFGSFSESHCQCVEYVGFNTRALFHNSFIDYISLSLKEYTISRICLGVDICVDEIEALIFRRKESVKYFNINYILEIIDTFLLHSLQYVQAKRLSKLFELFRCVFDLQPYVEMKDVKSEYIPIANKENYSMQAMQRKDVAKIYLQNFLNFPFSIQQA